MTSTVPLGYATRPGAAVAPPPAASGSASSAPAPTAMQVPDIVEDRRRDSAGGIVVRRYVRGRLLGKGGFARCYLFSRTDAAGGHGRGSRVMAGKCVDKASLTKSKTKQKVRRPHCHSERAVHNSRPPPPPSPFALRSC